MTRGLRNNNPGNIRISSTVWAGQVPPSPELDKEFVTFSSPEYGIRAMAKVLKTYMSRGVNTVEKIITTWAPPSENDTSAYVKSVVAQTGLGAKQVLTPEYIAQLIPAIIKHENGSQPYTPAQIAKGVSLS